MTSIKTNKKIIIYSVLIYLSIYMYLYMFYLFDKYTQYIESINAANMIFTTTITTTILGISKDKSTRLKRKTLIISLIIIMIYSIIMFILGLKLGFLKNAYSLKIKNIINNILSPLIILITSEILRYVILKNNRFKEYKLIFILTTIILTLIDISNKLSLKSLNKNIKIFKTVTKVIIPSLIKNIVLTYLTYNTGYKLCIIYRLVIDLNVFLLPVFPNVSDYIIIIISILIPITIYIYSSRNINDEEKKDNKDILGVKDITILTTALAMVLLLSKEFNYYLMAVASPSMEPNINIGDIVLVSKISNDDEIKKNDIVTFVKQNKVVVHRIVEKKKNTTGEYRYQTKGDANNTIDSEILSVKRINGKVIKTIPYIGLPIVWFYNKTKEKGDTK